MRYVEVQVGGGILWRQPRFATLIADKFDCGWRRIKIFAEQCTQHATGNHKPPPRRFKAKVVGPIAFVGRKRGPPFFPGTLAHGQGNRPYMCVVRAIAAGSVAVAQRKFIDTFEPFSAAQVCLSGETGQNDANAASSRRPQKCLEYSFYDASLANALMAGVFVPCGDLRTNPIGTSFCSAPLSPVAPNIRQIECRSESDTACILMCLTCDVKPRINR